MGGVILEKRVLFFWGSFLNLTVTYFLNQVIPDRERSDQVPTSSMEIMGRMFVKEQEVAYLVKWWILMFSFPDCERAKETAF